MKCSVCRLKAVIDSRRHNSAFCRPCYLTHIERQVQRAIDAYQMLSPGDRILVAVSGGKDSLSLWDLLVRLGYRTVGLHLDLGIGDYSGGSRQVTEAFAAEWGLALQVIDLRELTGLAVPELADRTRRPPCSACGLTKRYVMNRAAVEGGFSVLATGHNLDDMSATLFGNLLHWQTEQLARMHPVRPATHPRLARSVKPLIRITDREAAAYAFLQGIGYYEEECPNAEGATSLNHKEILNQMELKAPGTKQAFYFGFLKKAQEAFARTDGVALRACALCGQVTTTEICAFCRMLERAEAPREVSAGPVFAMIPQRAPVG